VSEATTAGTWLVLADGTSHDAVDDAAHGTGFSLVNVVPRDDAFPRQRIYARPGGATFLHDVLDHTLGARYVVIAGAELDAADELRARLDVIDAAALLPLCSDPDATVAVRALKLLGIAARGRIGDGERAALDRAATSPNPAIRAAAAAAAAFAGIVSPVAQPSDSELPTADRRLPTRAERP
jgi:hypothetical protein